MKRFKLRLIPNIGVLSAHDISSFPVFQKPEPIKHTSPLNIMIVKPEKNRLVAISPL